MRLKPQEILSRLNASYWFVPLAVTSLGILLATALLLVESQTKVGLQIPLFGLGAAESARSLLSAIIGAMITAISVTFSVTVVALTVAAQHFGPRVLSNFVRHTSAQVVLGTFMATFVYAVLVLSAMEAGGADAEAPQLAVAGAVALVILSIGALIYYVHHISASLQIGELAADIGEDLRAAIRQVHGKPRSEDGGAPAASDRDGAARTPEAPPDAVPVLADETGYVQRVNHEAIASEAERHGAVVWIRRESGSFVFSRTPLAMVHPPEACNEELAKAVRRASIVGRDRTQGQDVEFSVKQLVEVALRALSPGVNEPFTALTCIDRLTAGLAIVAASPKPSSIWRDKAGNLRVVCQAQDFRTLLRAAFDPIRIFAGTNPAIYARLLDGIAEIALLADRPEDRTALAEQSDLIVRVAREALQHREDRDYVESRYERIPDHFRGTPSSARR